MRPNHRFGILIALFLAGQPVQAQYISSFWRDTLERLAAEPIDAREADLREPLPYKSAAVARNRDDCRQPAGWFATRGWGSASNARTPTPPSERYSTLMLFRPNFGRLTQPTNSPGVSTVLRARIISRRTRM